MLTSVAGTEYAYRADQEVDAPEDRARDLIRGNHAVAVDTKKTPDKAEHATSKAADKAEKR